MMEIGDYDVNMGFLIGVCLLLLGIMMMLLHIGEGIWLFPFFIGLFAIIYSLAKPSKYEQAGGTYEGGIMGSLKKLRDRVCCVEEGG